LGLPDSSPDDTFSAVRDSAPAVPIVVLTGQDDEGTAIRTISEGAQDYLTKHELSNNILLRSIRYSLERHVASQRRLTERITELQIFETLAPESLEEAERSIAEVHPGVFAGAAQAYGNLVDLSVSSDYGGKDDDVRDQSRAIAILLGQLRASPRDLAAVHTTVLSDRQQVLDPVRFQVYEDVARLLLLRITGELANYYLEQIATLGTGAPAAPTPSPPPAAQPAAKAVPSSPPRAKPAAKAAPTPSSPPAAQPATKAAPRHLEPVAAPGNGLGDASPVVKLGAVEVTPLDEREASEKDGVKFTVYGPDDEVRTAPATSDEAAKAKRLTAADYAAWAERMKVKRDELRAVENDESAKPRRQSDHDWSTDALFGRDSDAD